MICSIEYTEAPGVKHGANSKSDIVVRVGVDSFGTSHGDDDQFHYRRGQK